MQNDKIIKTLMSLAYKAEQIDNITERNRITDSLDNILMEYVRDIELSNGKAETSKNTIILVKECLTKAKFIDKEIEQLLVSKSNTIISKR